VIRRILNKREHVNKQIFKVLERAQVRMDVNVNTIADITSNTSLQFAKYLIQREFMKCSRDKVIMTHLMTVFLNLGHHANLRAVRNIAAPLLTDTEHAKWLTSLGD
jgi:hypothetical protein